MQNYGQQQGYQRPGSTTSFTGQQPPPPPPPAYGGYQSAGPQHQSQWAPPGQPQNQQWNQPQPQSAGGYNPGTYGAMPGGQQAYPPQQHDQPPPPPPKPYGFAGAVQQQQQQQQQGQVWQQQQPPSHTPQQQGGYPVHGGAQPQQQYNNAAPPPPSATPGGSYFPPAQGGRPGSIYGASQMGTPAGQPNLSTVASPNEQQPAYIPPSLTGQGVQAYMPSNTNPMPGVYVPPPPDVPAWQQAQHAPLQGGDKKFKYTKPSVDPSFYAQGYQGPQSMQQAPPPLPPRHHDQYAQPQGQHQGLPQQPHAQHTQYPQQVHPQGPYGQISQPQHQQYGQGQGGLHQQQTQQPYDQGSRPEQSQFESMRPPVGASNVSKPAVYDQPPHMIGMPPPPSTMPAPNAQGASNVSKPYNEQPNQVQWVPDYQAQAQHNQPNPYAAQQQWQQGQHQQQPSLGGQPIEAPKPLARTDTASSAFFDQVSPQSQPVSPVNQRQSVSFGSGQQTGLGRNGSVSSIALANLQAQREGNRTASPKPPPPKLPTPPPPRDHKSKFDALGTGGPSDWEQFGGGEEIDDEEFFAKKNEPAMLDSTEIPASRPSQPELAAGPSPPSTHGWPSPAAGPAGVHTSTRQDTFQPTPPPTVARLAQQPAESTQSSFITGDAAMPAPLRLSPKPAGDSRPPSTQQSFVMGEGAWQPPKQGTPVQHQMQHQPPLASQGFVMDDGSVATHASSKQGPYQQQHHPPASGTSFIMTDGDRGASQRTPTQERSAWGAQPTVDHSAELKAKDEAMEQLRAQSEKELSELRASMEKLRTEAEATKAQLMEETAELKEQIEAMRVATEETKANTEARQKDLKDKNITIERLREDVEGKDHNIQERETTIADLRRQLEAEKTKEQPEVTHTPADLIPEIDPWYVGSLERYIAMLRGEANEHQVEDKIRTFKGFLKAESEIRGIPYYDEPPAVQRPTDYRPEATEYMASNVSKLGATDSDLDINIAPHGQTESAAVKTSAPVQPLNVNVQSISSPTDDGYDYSPGGRPMLKRKGTIPQAEEPSFSRSANMSAQSTAILTPTSSVEDDLNRTPVQSPPEEQPQPQYKAYVPPAAAATTSEPAPLVHRQTTSISNVAPTPSTNIGKGHDEIFFGAHEPENPKPSSRPASRDLESPEVTAPPPLSFASNRAASTIPPSKKDAGKTLASLLPSQTDSFATNHQVEQIHNKLVALKSHANNVDEVVKTWEKSAALTRRKNDNARRKREEDEEDNNNEAFDNNEISYADLNQLEEDFKEKEAALKAKEDRDEYENYITEVFDRVYDDLQADIKDLMDLYVDAERLLHTSVSGVKSLQGGDVVGTQPCLELLKEVHDRIVDIQEKVVQAVADRDKRYKKTEIAPLYAAGNIAKMKTVEKHFENAEKQALVRAKRDKAARVGELVTVAEDVVVNAVGIDQREIDDIVAAVKDLNEDADNEEILTRAHDTITRLKDSSKSLLQFLNILELDLNSAISIADIAQAKSDNADASAIKQLESKKAAEEKKLRDELDRKVKVLEQDGGEIDDLVQGKGGKVQISEEREKEARLKAALEAAKKRNGHV